MVSTLLTTLVRRAMDNLHRLQATTDRLPRLHLVNREVEHSVARAMSTMRALVEHESNKLDQSIGVQANAIAAVQEAQQTLDATTVEVRKNQASLSARVDMIRPEELNVAVS